MTPWFDAGALPAHAGVYARRAPAGSYACWDGLRWRTDAATPAEAARQQGATLNKASPWRGLVEPADGPCATCRGHTVLDRGADADDGVDPIDECPDC